jgi:hypothetical protein
MRGIKLSTYNGENTQASLQPRMQANKFKAAGVLTNTEIPNKNS